MAGVDVLLNNVGATAGVDIIGEWTTWLGGPGQFWVWGNLGGGEVHLEAALDISAVCCIEGTFISDATMTVASLTTFNLNHGTRIRAVLNKTLMDSDSVMVRAN